MEKKENEIEQTKLWELYERGVNYNRMRGLYADTDKNHRFYNGNQWDGLNSGEIQPIQKNIIKPIVKYKVGTINNNLYAINYSSNNTDEFRTTAKKICDMLNLKASQIFEENSMDYNIRQVTKKACINAESIIYANHTDDGIKNEILSKNDIVYGNENSSNIQKQPYMVIKSRKPISEVIEIYKSEKEKQKLPVLDEEIALIVGDKDYNEEAGDDAKQEVNDMCTLLTKLYKKDGTVHFDMATKHVDIKTHKDSGLTLYPVTHMVWEEVEGSARGEGEVKYLIPNQIEINRTLTRRAISIKLNAYPKQIVNLAKIANPDAVDKVGVTVYTNDISVDDVNKVFGTTKPAQMSPDAREFERELISDSRELAGAGDIATGEINPEKASGRAILAVKQASQEPLTEQVLAVKKMLEDLARIYLDMWIVYDEELEIITEENDQEVKYTVTKEQLERLKTLIKTDITPKGSFDKYAQEMSLEGLLNNKHITFEEYVDLLSTDSVMPKQPLEELLKKRKETQEKMAEMESKAIKMQQQMDNYLLANEGIDGIEAQGQEMMANQGL